MKYRTKTYLALTLASLFIGYSGLSAEQQVLSPLKTANLGAIDLPHGKATRHDVGDGRVCVITATMGFSGVNTYVVAIEQSGKAQGVPKRQSVVFDINKPVEVTLDGAIVVFTPRIVFEPNIKL